MGVAHPKQPSRFADFLRQHRDDVARGWEREVRQLAVARRLDRPTLIDRMSHFVERIGDVTDELTVGTRTWTGEVPAARYGVGRLAHGFEVSEVLRELSVLRDCIMSQLEPMPYRGHMEEQGLLHLA